MNTDLIYIILAIFTDCCGYATLLLNNIYFLVDLPNLSFMDGKARRNL